MSLGTTQLVERQSDMHTGDLGTSVRAGFASPIIKYRLASCHHDKFVHFAGTRKRVSHNVAACQSDRALTTCKAPATDSTIKRPRQSQQNAQETDVVVIGSGIGGLCCAALLAKYGLKVGLAVSVHVSNQAYRLHLVKASGCHAKAIHTRFWVRM